MKCNTCNSNIDKLIYASNGEFSITSLCQIKKLKTEVYFCDFCGHIQSNEIPNVEEFYDKEYKILVDSEEEDQLYEIKDNKKVFRYEHQKNVLLNKLKIPDKAKVLDYGCAKATTLRMVMSEKKDIEPYLFDISDTYISFWKNFVKEGNYATYTVKKEWENSFDLITSFFSFEHTVNLEYTFKSVFSLLKENGYLYFIVPNVLDNIADLIVCDHVNHFSASSLEYILKSVGFTNIEIDLTSHRGAIVAIAQKTSTKELPVNNDLTQLEEKVQKISFYWSNFSNEVLTFEEANKGLDSAIYGSGFYGSFIASLIKDLDKVKYFLDQSPFRQGKTLLNKKIISPYDLEENINVIYVGLNPIHAKGEIQKVDSWKNRNNIYFYPNF